MTPTANSSQLESRSGIAPPSTNAAPASAKRVSAWPSPQVRPCLMMSSGRLCREASVATAAGPVLVHHVAEAQVADAGAAVSAQPSDGRGVGADPEQEAKEVARALERSAMVRGAQADERVQSVQPAMPGKPSIVARAASHE